MSAFAEKMNEPLTALEVSEIRWALKCKADQYAEGLRDITNGNAIACISKRILELRMLVEKVSQRGLSWEFPAEETEGK